MEAAVISVHREVASQALNVLRQSCFVLCSKEMKGTLEGRVWCLCVALSSCSTESKLQQQAESKSYVTAWWIPTLPSFTSHIKAQAESQLNV